jgi:hypothetical protein
MSKAALGRSYGASATEKEELSWSEEELSLLCRLG